MYFIVLIISLVLGIWFSEQTIFLAPFSTTFLAAIFFFSALKINLKDVAKYTGRKGAVVSIVIFMLILLPIATFYVTKFFAPDLAIAFMILAAMPSGMTAPLLSEIAGGRQSFALVLTVATSLLAPFTMPAIIKTFSGTAVEVSALDMFYSLAIVIFIPFLLANILKPFARKLIKETEKYFKPISIIFLGLLITGIVAKQAPAIRETILGNGGATHYLVALFMLFIIFHLIGYFIFAKGDRADKITITVNVTYMNFTLAVFLVDRFFSAPEIIVPVVLSVLPWAILLVPFKYLMRRI